MKKYLVLGFLLLGNSILFGQDSIRKIMVDKKDKIYVDFTVKNPRVFTHSENQDGFYLLKNSQILSLKTDGVNFFYKWLNPLTNNLKMTDSIYIDPRDKEIQEYIKKVINQFNVPASSSLPNPAFTAISGCNSKSFSFTKPEYLELLNLGNSQLTGANNAFCDVFKSLYNLEQRGIENENDSIQTYRKKLIEISDPKEVKRITDEIEKSLKKITDSYKEDLFTLISFEKDFNNRAIINTDPLLYSKFEKLYNSEFNLLETNKNLVIKLSEYIAILRESIKEESDEISGYFYLHTAEIPSGKESSSKLTRITKKFDGPTEKFKEDGKIVNEFTIRRYDIINPKIGTGIFYSNAKLSTFGVSTNDEDQLTVSEDEIEENTAVVALFLNLNFDLNSRYLSPLFQIGIDPTKKRPYLLLGGGISIPSSKFSITGGPLWTWNASLEKLSIGDVIESSTEVEEDITYKFDVKPKGYYLGLTYSF